MKLIHNTGSALPQMYKDSIANTLHSLIWPTEWEAMHIAAPLNLKRI